VTVEAARLLNQYEIGAARHEIDDFFWRDLCDYYLEIVKERLYQPEIHGYPERRSAQRALYYCMLNILKLYAIYVPHITEVIYQDFFRRYEKSVSLHLLRWDTKGVEDVGIISFGERLKETIAEVRKYKTENALSMKAEIPEVVISANAAEAELFRRTTGDIKACCAAKEVKIIIG
jgi:valyl-tRNA synthetase